MLGPYVIRVFSHKGGVGKTTVAVNLAVSLGLMDYKVLLVDGDLVCPTVGFYFGIQSVNMGTRDVLYDRRLLKSSIVRDEKSGIDVLPAKLAADRVTTDMAVVLEAAKDTKPIEGYDFVVNDFAPGLDPGGELKLYNDTLIVATPTMSSFSNLISISERCKKAKLDHHYVINRVTNKKYEASTSEIETGYGEKALAILPEDPAVPDSEGANAPVCTSHKNSPFSSSFKDLVKFYAAKRNAK